MGLVWVALLAGGIWAVARLGVENWLVYAVAGVAMWIGLHHAGVHGTIAGVLLGLLIPAVTRRPVREVLGELRQHSRRTLEVSERLDTSDLLYVRDGVREAVPPLQRFEHVLHPWVAFFIMPLFGLANSGVSMAEMTAADFTAPVFLGVAVGLFVGKQLGNLAFTWAAVKLGVAEVPGGAPWSRVYGVAMVAGIGFTVALFIANLAFGGHPELLNQARLGVLVGSLVSGVSGMLVLRLIPARAGRGGPGAGEPRGLRCQNLFRHRQPAMSERTHAGGCGIFEVPDPRWPRPDCRRVGAVAPARSRLRSSREPLSGRPARVSQVSARSCRGCRSRSSPSRGARHLVSRHFVSAIGRPRPSVTPGTDGVGSLRGDAPWPGRTVPGEGVYSAPRRRGSGAPVMPPGRLRIVLEPRPLRSRCQTPRFGHRKAMLRAYTTSGGAGPLR